MPLPRDPDQDDDRPLRRSSQEATNAGSVTEFKDRTPTEIRLLLADLAKRYQGGFAVQTVSSLALCLSLLAAPQQHSAPRQQPTLVFVTSANCGYCDDMKPILARMAQEGYRIETIRGDQNRPLVERLGISGYPTFVLTDGSQEMGRLVGAQDYSTMVEFAQPARQAPSSEPPRELPELGIPSTAPAAVGPVPPSLPMQERSQLDGRGDLAGGATNGQDAAVQRALGATVRIKIDEGGSVSYGTGVVVDVHRSAAGAEALILTCGHIFRDSQGKAQLTVDFPTRQDNQPVSGRLLEYVAKDADIGAIYVVLPFDVAPVPVAGQQYQSQIGDAVFSVGCDQGGPARVMQSKVTNVDRYIGPPNIEASGAPSLGRSGGGLFDAQGRLIGICNAMDAADDEGIYASLPLVHWQLANIGMDRLYRQDPLAQNALPIQPLVNEAPGRLDTNDVKHDGTGIPGYGSLVGHAEEIAAPNPPQLMARITLFDPARPHDPGRTFDVQPTAGLLREIGHASVGAATTGTAALSR